MQWSIRNWNLGGCLRSVGSTEKSQDIQPDQFGIMYAHLPN
jgi:hypothetical protein